MNSAAGATTTAGGKVSVMTRDRLFVAVTKGRNVSAAALKDPGYKCLKFKSQKREKKKMTVDLWGCFSQAPLFQWMNLSRWANGINCLTVLIQGCNSCHIQVMIHATIKQGGGISNVWKYRSDQVQPDRFHSHPESVWRKFLPHTCRWGCVSALQPDAHHIKGQWKHFTQFSASNLQSVGF